MLTMRSAVTGLGDTFRALLAELLFHDDPMRLLDAGDRRSFGHKVTTGLVAGHAGGEKISACLSALPTSEHRWSRLLWETCAGQQHKAWSSHLQSIAIVDFVSLARRALDVPASNGGAAARCLWQDQLQESDHDPFDQLLAGLLTEKRRYETLVVISRGFDTAASDVRTARPYALIDSSAVFIPFAYGSSLQRSIYDPRKHDWDRDFDVAASLLVFSDRQKWEPDDQEVGISCARAAAVFKGEGQVSTMSEMLKWLEASSLGQTARPSVRDDAPEHSIISSERAYLVFMGRGGKAD